MENTNIQNKDTTAKKVPFAVVEAYKTIRTNLTFSLPQDGCKSFVISSSVPGEGKSTTAVNIAVAFSQLGKNVLLIDADLRRASIHKKLKLINTKGLYSVLSGSASFDDCVQNCNKYLDVLTSGPFPSNPIELIESMALSELLNKLHQRYDYIIFDSTPINIVSDAISLAPKTDGLVLVVRENSTRRDDVHRSLSACQFANIRVLGTIINGVNPKHSGKYTYRKYRSGYRYNYNYKYQYK
ncbi:MAG: CpsD/CapB family tyrosine-protein kinase [Acutalibacteraceae bacterium]|nr:CpsD/CapB family tyrosine-protein kinase [Acutalibacteraceae bacterium]